jgi:hypothetical protein
LAAVLSFHYVDVFRRIALAGVFVTDSARVMCAVAILILGLAALKADRS